MEDLTPSDEANPADGARRPILALVALGLAVLAPCCLFMVAPVGLALALTALRRGDGVFIAAVAAVATLAETVLLALAAWHGPVEVVRFIADDDAARVTELTVDAGMLSSNFQTFEDEFDRKADSLEALGWGDRKAVVWGNDFRSDPWGRRYRIGVHRDHGERRMIVSDGPDGIPDTADDIAIVDLETNEALDVALP